MLNFIAAALTSYVVTELLHVPETVHTPPVIEAARLMRLGEWVPDWSGSAVNLCLLIALAVAVVLHLVLFRTGAGFAVRAVGLSPGAAEANGVSLARTTLWSMAIAGGLAGLVGVNFVLGYKHYFEEGFTAGVGYMGIAVALLGRNHPLGVVLAALLFGTLSQGGLVIKQARSQGARGRAPGHHHPRHRRLERAGSPAARAARASEKGSLVMWETLFSWMFLAQVLRISVPYVLAALGGVFSERAGVVALALEGELLLGAFGSTVVTQLTGSAVLGVLAGLAAGMLVASIVALVCIRWRGDQIVVGIAVNLLVVGATRFFLKLLYDSSSNSPRIDTFATPAWAESPLVQVLVNPLFLGP